MQIIVILSLNNYTVSVIAAAEESVTAVRNIEQTLLASSNPREIVDLIGSVAGVESIIVQDNVTNTVILSSELMPPSNEE